MLSTWFFVVIGLLVFGFGLMIFLGDDKSQTPIEGELTYKNGSPITPRHKRTLLQVETITALPTTNNVDRDALSDLANIAKQQQNNHSTPQNAIAAEQPSKPVDAGQNLAQPNPAQTEPIAPTTATPPATTQAKTENPSQVSSNNPTSIDELPKSHFQLYNRPVAALDSFFAKKEYFSNQDDEFFKTYKESVTILICPRNNLAGINGKSIIRIAHQYGLKFGEREIFHRYENPKGAGMLWFCMFGVSMDGKPSPDLIAIPDTKYRELVLFLPLPHPQALRGFDGMVQIAEAIAGELGADIYDSYHDLLNDSKLQLLRQRVIDYQG